MNMDIVWKGKMAFEAEGPSSGHKVVIDAAAEVGGENQGPRPMELLMMGLGGCTGIDIISILDKMRLELTSFHMEINGDRATEHPKRFTEIHMRYILEGPNLPKDKVERAVRLSQDKYCSASASLNANITASFVINGAEYPLESTSSDGSES